MRTTPHPSSSQSNRPHHPSSSLKNTLTHKRARSHPSRDKFGIKNQKIQKEYQKPKKKQKQKRDFKTIFGFCFAGS
ncbi:hypothetical protein A4A49_55811 [Nicotiana attenuata]|uniref:Uncharacterized protein n=1 Tax=Nicotiana attenuata TaxID=49451 RepID=A0A1J6IVX6_NICAT|nr:hypothetical protein A4A49_55811 [Nicotiana attenuata]